MPKLSLEETIKAYTNENGFAWGINTVMKSLAPGVSHDLTSAGEFIIDRWGYAFTQTSKASIQQNAGSVTPPAGFTNYSIRMGTTCWSNISFKKEVSRSADGLH